MQLTANGGIACDTDKFTVADTSGNVATAGTLSVTGATTLSSTLAVTGALSANGGITCDTDKFTVADTSGNVATAGTLDVTGATTLSSTLEVTGAIDANSTADIADTLTLSKASGTGLSVAADATISGNLTVAGDTITANVSTVTIEDPIITLGSDAN